jgi:hypothetical protein
VAAAASRTPPKTLFHFVPLLKASCRPIGSLKAFDVLWRKKALLKNRNQIVNPCNDSIVDGSYVR